LTPAEILREVPFGSRRMRPEFLRRALIETGVPYRCALCDLSNIWQELPLTLHVDHISGDFHDNRIENVRFLCPNCHAQTPNFAGKHKGNYAERTVDQGAEMPGATE
jgi:hypothetical protein